MEFVVWKWCGNEWYVINGAEYVVVVVDEDPKNGLPEPIKYADETKAERLQRVQHFARIGVWDLKEERLLARVRAEAAGTLREVGSRRAPSGEEAVAARARQANNCGLALAFRSTLSQSSP